MPAEDINKKTASSSYSQAFKWNFPPSPPPRNYVEVLPLSGRKKQNTCAIASAQKQGGCEGQSVTQERGRWCRVPGAVPQPVLGC